MAEKRLFHAVQSQGQRQYQEDSWAVLPPVNADDGLLLLVCDGMGGHQGGELAGRLASKTFARTFESGATGNPQLRLRQALETAHDAVRQAAEQDPAVHDMGTTLCAAYVFNNDLYWVSVGDSLIFLIRGGEAERINEDHSMAPVFDKLAASGEMTQEEALTDSRRNGLRSVVSADSIRLLDCQRRLNELQAGDTLVLASDGIATLTPEQIAKLVSRFRREGAEPLAQQLLEAVIQQQNPHQDNVTIVVYVHQQLPVAGWRRFLPW